MAFFEQLGKSLIAAWHSAVQKIKKLRAVSRLKKDISAHEKRISKTFLEIGRSYYEGHKDDELAESQEEIHYINKLHDKIYKAKEKIEQIKALTKCANCGATVPSKASFCNECGAKLNHTETEKDAGDSSSNANENRKNRIVGIVAVVLAAVVVICIILAAFGGRSPKRTVRAYIDAYWIDLDAEAVVDLLPQKLFDDKELDALVTSLDRTFNSISDYIKDEIDDSLKMSFDITEINDKTKKEIEELKEKYADYDIKISDAKIATVEITVKVDGLKDDKTTESEVSIVKIGRSWYIDPLSMDF